MAPPMLTFAQAIVLGILQGVTELFPVSSLGHSVILGLLLEHTLRVVFARPLAAAGFLLLNGLIMLFGEWVRRRAEVRRVVAAHERTAAGDRRLDTLAFGEAAAVGVAQVFALLPGISRSGI